MKSRCLVLFIRLLAMLPLRVARALGTLLGLLCWWTRGRMAQTTLTNLTLCFPALDKPARQSLARRSLIQTFQTICEAGAIWLWPADKTLALIHQVEGLELLQEAHARGSGVIVFGPHLGNWELLGLYLNGCGLGQTSQLFQPPDDASLGALIYQARSRAGARMVATDKKGVAELLQALKRGEVIGILPDQVPPDTGGEFATFFGTPALTMTLGSRLLQKTGAAAIFGFACRVDTPAPGFRMVFRAADPLIYAEHMPESVQGLNNSVEALVQEAPDQYQWEYKRFKRQPDGAPRPY